jgi:hypothetical protein
VPADESSGSAVPRYYGTSRKVSSSKPDEEKEVFELT